VGKEVKKVLFRAVVGFLGLASLFSTRLSAQQLATLNVTVADLSEHVISQARVAVRNVDAGAQGRFKEIFMAHIRLPEGIPGILGPMAFSPETAKPLNALAEVLLRGPNSLSAADREMIATYVSSQNDCYFCQHAHGAVAAYRLSGNEQVVDSVKANFEVASISEKLKALLAIAGKVQRGGKQVTNEDIARARQKGRNR
jgi:uncharacterized peroxidase-related enzyme